MPGASDDGADEGSAGGGGDSVRAAGGVVWRRGDDGSLRVLVAHRDRYDDWTFPKGKLEPGEGWKQGAIREVTEELGMVPIVGAKLGTTTYVDHRGRPKEVRYWAMTVPDPEGFVANDEVDAVEWCPLDVARRRLTYARDQGLVDLLVAAIA